MAVVFRLFQNRKGTALLTLLCCVGSVVATLLWNKDLAVMIDGVQGGMGLDRERIARCVVYGVFDTCSLTSRRNAVFIGVCGRVCGA